MARAAPHGFGPYEAVEFSNCGDIFMSRTRRFSSGVVDPVPKGRGDVSYRLFLLIGGRMDLVQGGGTLTLAPTDMVLCDASRPMVCEVPPGGETTGRGVLADWLTVRFPRVLVGGGVSPAATRLSGRSGAGQVLHQSLHALFSELPRIGDAERVRLSGVLVDLLSIVVNEHIGEPDRELQRIQHFAEDNLADPDLTPAFLAWAHHMSVRQLHKLFSGQGITVSAWIRGRRLQGWRHDLADPRNRDRPVQAVARDWGLANPAHAGRLFRAAYGITPAAYRRTALPE
jgi:AraC-like DNA-binding protein